MVIYFYISLLSLHWLVLPFDQDSYAGDPRAEEIHALNEQALEFLLEDPARTEMLAQEALELAEKIDAKEHIAYSYNILGLVNDDLGHYAVALDYYFLSLKYSKEIEDKQAMGISLNNIGQFFYVQGNNQLAVRYLEEALQLAIETEDELSVGYIHNNFGLINDDKGDFEAAFTHYQKALNIFTTQEDNEGKALALHNIAWLHYEQNNWDSTRMYVDQALELDIQTKDIEGIATDYYLLGMLHLQQHELEEALEQFNKGLQEASKIGAAPIMAKLYKDIANTLLDLGQYSKALINLEKYNALHDSTYSESDLTKISNFQVLYDVQLQQEELELLQSQKELSDLSLSFQQTFTYLLLICTIALLVLLFLLFIQNKQNSETIKALDRHNKIIQEQNEALALSNKELNLSKAKLKEFNETKDKFFSIISHDLKSPLNSLQGLMQLLAIQSDTLTPQELVHLAKALRHSIENLSDLLDNLLGWSMSQMGKIEQHPSRVNLFGVVKENISLLEMNAQAKNIQVENLVEEGVFILADLNMTSFVIRNLLSNAIKFTQDDGRIVLLSKTSNSHIYLSVSDNGIGISSDDLDKLFKLGQHFSTRGTAQEKGTGLGLILCKEFVEKNKGQIMIESTPQKGTKITVILPAYKTSPALS